MRTEAIKANCIDEAAEVIHKKLREEDPVDTTRHNAIYFDGWDGLGASAVLRAVGRRLIATASSSQEKEPGGLEFSQIFHVDCSKWESRRAMQRVVAEQVKLPPSVMEILDAQDEEDDYQGLAKHSRSEVPQITEAIYQKLVMKDRFLVIFHNGSNEEVDLNSFGFPLSGYLKNKVLWSFQGRFRVYPKTKVDTSLKNSRMTDVLLSAGSTDVPEDKLCKILHHEADEVAREMVMINSAIGGIDWPATAANYFLYMMKLYGMGNHISDTDMSTHSCNYWKCDHGMTMLQPLGDADTDDGADRLWLSADALHREMQLDEDYYQYLSSPVERSLHKRMAYWTSPTYGFMLTPDPRGQILKDMFQQYDKLCVLKLSACEFSFTSPPFLCCNNLRFLWLDHCRDGSSAAEEVKEEDICRFFQRLWVLDVRYPNKTFLSSDMMESMTQLKELTMAGRQGYIYTDLLQRRMHKIRRLRVEDHHLNERSLSFIDKMELFELSANSVYYGQFFIESNCSLETVIIRGLYQCVLSFTGCTKLKNIFLSGSFPQLQEINIIGAAVETLDLSAVTAPNLDELHLRECGELCAILWPAEDRGKIYLKKLDIDTAQAEGTVAAATGRVFDWHVSVKDARILRSLEPVKDYFGRNDAHVEVSSPTHLYGDAAVHKGNQIRGCEQLKGSAVYADVILTSKSSDEGDSSDAPVKPCICPPPPDVPSEGCYLHVRDHLRTKSQAASSIITLPGFICDGAKILHVHDSLHLTSIVAAPTASAMWNILEWCRVEGCPKLECVFILQFGPDRPIRDGRETYIFEKLRTAWVSDLPSARYIWNWSGSSTTIDIYNGEIFADLTLLHIDCCPNLIQIIHLPTVGVRWKRLERLEILWCSDLNVAFHSGTPYVTSLVLASNWQWTFSKLKHVLLHELPKLQNICHIGHIFMPELETIKIRGCWSLRTLPTVNVKRTNAVECDCEKEWWDRLEWESPEHASHYKPIHPRYYKKIMLRGSVLR